MHFCEKNAEWECAECHTVAGHSRFAEKWGSFFTKRVGKASFMMEEEEFWSLKQSCAQVVFWKILVYLHDWHTWRMCSALTVSHNLTKVTQPWLVLLPLERINSEITHSVPVVTFSCYYCWKSEKICGHSCMYNSRAWITTAFVWVYFGTSWNVLVYSICLFT